jgi:hypothetical protein
VDQFCVYSARTDLERVVEGEQSYWVHVAIDRFTGQVIESKSKSSMSDACCRWTQSSWVRHRRSFFVLLPTDSLQRGVCGGS